MIEFLKLNSWLLSVIAIFISLVAAAFTITDRLKSWRELAKTKVLKKDKATLQPLIDLQAENFYSTTIRQEKLSKTTEHRPHYEKLYFLIQRIDASTLSNKELASEIEHLKLVDSDDLFEPKSISDNTFIIQFSPVLYKVIDKAKRHLALIA